MSIAMTEITVRVGQELTKKQLAEINEGAKYPITYDPECPPSTDKALAEFAAKARAIRAKNKSVKPSVTIRMIGKALKPTSLWGKAIRELWLMCSNMWQGSLKFSKIVTQGLNKETCITAEQ